MKHYRNFREIELDLRRYDLERKIANEELKAVKNSFTDYTKPLPWVKTILKFFGKYGVLMLLKKIIK